MKILVVGNDVNINEFNLKFASHAVTYVNSLVKAKDAFASAEIIFDFLIEEAPEDFEAYSQSNKTVFLNSAKITLAELAYTCQKTGDATIIGFNGLPTLFNRNLLEVSLLDPGKKQELDAVMKDLGTGYSLVDDRVGMVTPRVICMIINEAYFTVQEGTASREDIDLAMKLGTNYPFGPFEWCERIGVNHVYELLEAVYEDTKDERYKICPLLKKEYLRTAT